MTVDANAVLVAIDQGVDQKRLKLLMRAVTLEVRQARDLEQQFAIASPQGRIFTLDQSELAESEADIDADRLGDEKWELVQLCLGAENKADAEHIYSAYLCSCEYFLTENPRDFINDGKRGTLESALGVKIRRMSEFEREMLDTDEGVR